MMTHIPSLSTQAEIQIWNDAVSACRAAASEEVERMEREAADGMPNPGRSVVRAVGSLQHPDDDRNIVDLPHEFMLPFLEMDAAQNASESHDERVMREGGTLSNGQEIYTQEERIEIRAELRAMTERAQVALEKSGRRRGPHPKIAALRAGGTEPSRPHQRVGRFEDMDPKEAEDLRAAMDEMTTNMKTGEDQ